MKKRIIIALAFLNTLGILALAFVHWGWIFMDRELSVEAKKFKSDLLEALDNGTRVEIVEHAWRWDSEQSTEPPYYEYKRVRLTGEQQNEFRKVFKEMPRKPQTDFLPCLFEPHHTIEIFDQHEHMQVIRICFQCGDTSWGDTETITPASFQSVFFKFIKPLGFTAERDWGALARERRGDLKTD